jgi:hypothetical protein
VVAAAAEAMGEAVGAAGHAAMAGVVLVVAEELEAPAVPVILSRQLLSQRCQSFLDKYFRPEPAEEVMDEGVNNDGGGEEAYMSTLEQEETPASSLEGRFLQQWHRNGPLRLPELGWPFSVTRLRT